MGVVVLVVAIILAGLALFLFYLERRLHKAERDIHALGREGRPQAAGSQNPPEGQAHSGSLPDETHRIR